MLILPRAVGRLGAGVDFGGGAGGKLQELVLGNIVKGTPAAVAEHGSQ